MINIHSLALRSDLMLSAWQGKIVEKTDYLVISTPSNPTFHWGNYLLFSSPPEDISYEYWLTKFNEEFPLDQGCNHIAFAWDASQTGNINKFLEGGFELHKQLSLLAKKVILPAHANNDISVRPLNSDDDWESAIELQVKCREEIYEEKGYELFRRRQMLHFRNMTAQNKGSWFGAFLGNRLVADLGIFFEGKVGRFQFVSTHPDFRKQGIWSRLVFESALYAFQIFKVTDLVIVAELDQPATRVYRSVGFEAEETTYGLSKWPRD